MALEPPRGTNDTWRVPSRPEDSNVQIRVIATLRGRDQKREFLILDFRTFCASPLVIVASRQKYEIPLFSMFFALSSLPSWFGLPLFVKTRAIATLEGTGEKREFLILRFSHILHFALYNGGFMCEIQKNLHFWDCTPSYGWMPHIATQNGWSRKKRSIW